MKNGNLWTGTLAALVWLLVASNAAAGPVIFAQPLSPRIANYSIDVQLDTAKHSLEAHEVLAWHNRTGEVIHELQFHLYLNAFRNNRSTLFREGGDWREDEEKDEGWGFSEVRRIALQGGGDLTARMENIEQLMYSAANHENLMDFLEEASLVKEDKKEEEGQDQDSRVNLSTIHASKGLEYQAVFVVGCEENLLPHWKSKENDSEISEERRLMYVAMTRAESYLYLTSASYRKGQYNPVSRFIEEIAGSIHVSVN